MPAATTAQRADHNRARCRIALVSNDDFAMYNFRRDLIRTLLAENFDVSVIVPPGEYVPKLEALGVKVFQVPIHRFVAPWDDIKTTLRYFTLFRREKFDLVHCMTIKPNIYATIAARAAGIKNVVCLVPGMGFGFSEVKHLRAKLVQAAASRLSRLAFRLCRRVWFQNSDDRDSFVASKIISRRKAVVIRSGGINITEFSPNSVPTDSIDELRGELGLSRDERCVVMVSRRLVWSKGVREFVDAATSLTERLPNWKFVMLCPRDEESWDSVPRKYLEENLPSNLVLVNRFRNDVERFIAMANVLVLPSYYPEGVPRTLLEGLAMGKPIVTTHHRGCRETVDEGVNGFLVPARDAAALTERIAELAGDDAMCERFGRASRLKAETEFDKDLIVAQIVKHVYDIDIQPATIPVPSLAVQHLPPNVKSA